MKQNNLKKRSIANLMVWIRDKRERGENIFEALFTVGDFEFGNISEAWELQNPLGIEIDPVDWITIFQKAISYRRKAESKDRAKAREMICFSNNEFALLVVVLRDGEPVSSAFLRDFQGLSRGELDSGRNRNFIWSSIVEQKFNDLIYHPHLDVSDYCTSINAAKVPLPYRTGPFLKDQFLAARKIFSIYFDRWNRSGQNETNNFELYLPEGNTPSHVNAEGERCIVIASAL